MNDYETLRSVLDAAFDQAANGKGKERHARGNPFHKQHMQTISQLIGTDRGMAFQAIKKLTEGLDLPDHDARERELLGAIVYIAGIVVFHRAVEDEAREFQTGLSDEARALREKIIGEKMRQAEKKSEEADRRLDKLLEKERKNDNW